MSTLRRRVELKAGPAVVLLSRLPRVVPFLVIAALLIGGLVVHGVIGAAVLGVLALLLATLLFLSWPALQPQARALRLAVLGLILLRAAFFLL